MSRRGKCEGSCQSATGAWPSRASRRGSWGLGSRSNPDPVRHDRMHDRTKLRSEGPSRRGGGVGVVRRWLGVCRLGLWFCSVLPFSGPGCEASPISFAHNVLGGRRASVPCFSQRGLSGGRTPRCRRLRTRRGPQDQGSEKTRPFGRLRQSRRR